MTEQRRSALKQSAPTARLRDAACAPRPDIAGTARGALAGAPARKSLPPLPDRRTATRTALLAWRQRVPASQSRPAVVLRPRAPLLAEPAAPSWGVTPV